MARPAIDSDVVGYIMGDPTLHRRVIPYMYANEIMKEGQLVECSRWGVNIGPIMLPEELQPYFVDSRIPAIREAGHAIVFLGLGGRFRSIEYHPVERWGEVKKIRMEDRPPEGSDDYWKQSDAQVISTAGGPIATSMFLSGNPSTWTIGCMDDFICLCTLEMDNSYNAVQHMVDKAKNIVEKQWKVVEAIFEELMKRERLRYVDCKRIYDRINDIKT